MQDESEARFVVAEDLLWRNVHLNYTDCFREYGLIQNNGIYMPQCEDGVLRLLHVTKESNLQKIIDKGELNPSSGSLVGAIYCTPVSFSNHQYRMHNLGEYYFEREFRYSSGKNHGKSRPCALLIEIEAESGKNAGIDYTRFGCVHDYFYGKYMSSAIHRQFLGELEKSIHKAHLFIDYSCSLLGMQITLKDAERYVEKLKTAYCDFPFLGCLVFEAISQYVFMNQESQEVSRAIKRREVYSVHLKDLLFNVYPELQKKFEPEIIMVNDGLIRKMMDSRFLLDFVPSCFLVDFVKILVTLIYRSFSYPSYLGELDPVRGHILHRYAKKHKDKLDYDMIREMKAESIWKYWDANNIVTVYNVVNDLPRGEIGVNPCLAKIYPNVIHRCDVLQNQLFPCEKIEAQFGSELVERKQKVFG